MSEMIDRVAEAIRLRAIERGHPVHPAMVRHMAAAAVEAMREPTNGMLQAAGEEWYEAQLAWDTMIDTALK